jgi:DnaJ-class molecular chaperone
MAIKNYYLVLGVHREVSDAGIRSAYKDLAKKLHPDRIGADSTEAFQAIAEAYQTLSDPEKRRLHNRLLDQEEDKRREAGQRVNVRRGLEPESLSWERVSIMEDYQHDRPFFDRLYQQFLKDFTRMQAPNAIEELNFEVILTADEARHGGVISVQVPTYYRCSLCRGSGRDWMFPCFDCQGSRVIETQTPVNIRFPPGVRSGTVIEASIRELGIKNCSLRLCLVVER